MISGLVSWILLPPVARTPTAEGRGKEGGRQGRVSPSDHRPGERVVSCLSDVGVVDAPREAEVGPTPHSWQRPTEMGSRDL